MITALDHIHVYASDPERTLRFYQDCFDAERMGTLPNKGGTGNHFLLLAGQVLVVSAFPPGMEPASAPDVGDGAVRSGFGVAHFGLQSSNLDADLVRLETQGVHVHDEPTRSGPIRYVYVSAPDGVVIEIVELILPAKLRRLRSAFNAYNKVVHASKRAFVRQLFKGR
ncbi:MAG: VOC family protein [Deltaproteobacteria bacterium]|nr:VOC family protein [Deltaproteobacteria bacterium]MBW1878950.1 VOC family protein [Deltaproteobacteria bacterium]